jgi:hypothetical protein
MSRYRNDKEFIDDKIEDNVLSSTVNSYPSDFILEVLYQKYKNLVNLINKNKLEAIYVHLSNINKSVEQNSGYRKHEVQERIEQVKCIIEK